MSGRTKITALDKSALLCYNEQGSTLSKGEKGRIRVELDDLMVALARGNRDAFKEIYEQTKKTVYYIALSVMKEKSLAEDVMQSAYLNVIRYAGNYRQGTNPRAWIARIAKNEAINLKKKRAKEVAIDEQENIAAFPTVETDDYGLLVDLARKILPEDEFAILMLVTAEGYKRREIAQMLSIPLATVTWKYSKALKTMKHALTEGERRGK